MVCRGHAGYLPVLVAATNTIGTTPSIGFLIFLLLPAGGGVYLSMARNHHNTKGTENDDYPTRNDGGGYRDCYASPDRWNARPILGVTPMTTIPLLLLTLLLVSNVTARQPVRIVRIKSVLPPCGKSDKKV